MLHNKQVRRTALATVAALLLLTVSLLTLPGCDKVQTQQAVGATAQGTLLTGLTIYGQKHPAEARKAAQAVADVTGKTILPYLNGDGTNVASTLLETALSTGLADLDPTIKASIISAAGILDAFLPKPEAGKVLNPDQVAVLKSFFQGLNSGAVAYLSGTRQVTEPSAKLKKALEKPHFWLQKL
jgi:hypothetical protein